MVPYRQQSLPLILTYRKQWVTLLVLSEVQQELSETQQELYVLLIFSNRCFAAFILLLRILIRVELQEILKELNNNRCFEIIEHQLILCKDHVELDVLCQNVDLIVFNSFLLELRSWFVELLQKLNQLFLYSSSPPDLGNV